MNYLRIAMFCLSTPVNDIYQIVSAAMAATFLKIRLPLVTLASHPRLSTPVVCSPSTDHSGRDVLPDVWDSLRPTTAA